MTSSVLGAISNELADAVAGVAPAVVQVQNGRRPVSGLVYADGVVLTTARALGRGDRLRVRRHDGQTFEAELAGWDPATGLAVLRVGGLDVAPVAVSEGTARVGHIAVAVARSWSNAITASAGIVSVIGGPLPTGFRRAIDEVIRTTAPMHDGFAGGAFVDTGGKLIGVPTAAADPRPCGRHPGTDRMDDSSGAHRTRHRETRLPGAGGATGPPARRAAGNSTIATARSWSSP